MNEKITGETSDGYHTFNELYDHRIALFLQLVYCHSAKAWRSKLHSDGTDYPGWFILGIFKKPGLQITYHVPLEYWKAMEMDHVEILERAPEYDGHTSNDVIKRLENLKYFPCHN